MTAPGFLILTVLQALLVAAAVSDLLTMTIPNWLSLIMAAAFPAVALAAGVDLPTIGWHAAAGLFVLAVGFGLFALNWIGGGDAKLAAAIGLWIGPFLALLDWALLFALYGGVLTIVLLLARRFPLPVLLGRHAWIARLHDPKTGVPYGVALSAAALTIYPATNIFVRLVV